MKKFFAIFAMGFAIGFTLLLLQPELSGYFTGYSPPRDVGSAQITSFFSPGTEEIFLSALRSARGNIEVEMYVFTYKPLQQELAAAVARGVDVKIILEPGVHDNAKIVTFLADHGVKVRWANTQRFDKTHSKFLIIDNETVIVGSNNWTNHALNLNREAAVRINSAEVARDFIRIFYSDWEIASAAS